MAYIVPLLFVISPPLLLQGEPEIIVFSIATAIAGVWLTSIAIAGFFVRALSPPMRLAFAAAGLLALIPAETFAGAVYTDIAGVIAGAVLIGFEYYGSRLRRQAGSAPAK